MVTFSLRSGPPSVAGGSLVAGPTSTPPSAVVPVCLCSGSILPILSGDPFADFPLSLLPPALLLVALLPFLTPGAPFRPFSLIGRAVACRSCLCRPSLVAFSCCCIVLVWCPSHRSACGSRCTCLLCLFSAAPGLLLPLLPSTPLVSPSPVFAVGTPPPVLLVLVPWLLAPRVPFLVPWSRLTSDFCRPTFRVLPLLGCAWFCVGDAPERCAAAPRRCALLSRLCCQWPPVLFLAVWCCPYPSYPPALVPVWGSCAPASGSPLFPALERLPCVPLVSLAAPRKSRSPLCFMVGIRAPPRPCIRRLWPGVLAPLSSRLPFPRCSIARFFSRRVSARRCSSPPAMALLWWHGRSWWHGLTTICVSSYLTLSGLAFGFLLFLPRSFKCDDCCTP